jgi:hypothetical protein
MLVGTVTGPPGLKRREHRPLYVKENRLKNLGYFFRITTERYKKE